MRLGAQTVAGLKAELLGCSNGLEWQRVRRIWSAQETRRRRGSRKERGDSGHSGLYPHNGRRFADEDVHAKHSSKQLRGQLRGVARGGGSAPAAEHPPLPITVAGLINSVSLFVKSDQNLN